VAEIGSYRLDAELGRGATGTVYRATHIPDGLVAAVKVLNPALAGDESYIARFHAEAGAMAQIDHPGCVKVYQHGREAGSAWIAMEYVDGASLRAVLGTYGRLSASQACGVLSGALAGLGHAHQAGVVHRDVKPDNLLADRAGHSKLADFGLTTPRGYETQAWSPLEGSPAYMSPEQVRGNPLDARSDIYSAAIVLHELITGNPPYAAENSYALMRAQVEAPLPDLAGVPPRIGALIRWAMAKDPTERPQTVEQFAAELKQAADRDLGAGWFATAGIAGLVAGAATATSVAHASPGAPGAPGASGPPAASPVHRLLPAQRLGRAATLKVVGGIAAAALVTGGAAVAVAHSSSHASTKTAVTSAASKGPTTRKSVSLAVTPCSLTGYTNGSSVTNSIPPPGSLATHLAATLPAPVATEAAFYGATPSPVSNHPTYLLAPAEDGCQQFLGADGGNTISVSPPGSASNTTPAVEAILSPGGLGPSVTFACPYFPAAKAAADRTGFGGQCSPPAGQRTETLASTVVAWQNRTAATGPTDGVIVSNGDSGIGENCTLPAAETGLCEASLALFLDNHGGAGAVALARVPWFATK
jgi:hypothetical protein